MDTRSHLDAGHVALHPPLQEDVDRRALLALGDHRLARRRVQPPQSVTHVRELLLVVQVDEARHLPQCRSYYFSGLGRRHAPHRLSIFIIVGQDVVDLAVLELAHVVLDGVTKCQYQYW